MSDLPQPLICVAFFSSVSKFRLVLPSCTCPSAPCEIRCTALRSWRAARVSVICAMPSLLASSTTTSMSRPSPACLTDVVDELLVVRGVGLDQHQLVAAGLHLLRGGLGELTAGVDRALLGRRGQGGCVDQPRREVGRVQDPRLDLLDHGRRARRFCLLLLLLLRFLAHRTPHCPHRLCTSLTKAVTEQRQRLLPGDPLRRSIRHRLTFARAGRPESSPWRRGRRICQRRPAPCLLGAACKCRQCKDFARVLGTTGIPKA